MSRRSQLNRGWCALVVGLLAVVVRQDPSGRQRFDSPSATALGLIAGTVTDVISGEPLAGAVVTLSTLSPSNAASRSSTTGADGRFAWNDLAPGTYQLAAARSGYIVPTTTARSERRIELRRGHRYADARIALVPGGVISGTVTDEFGDPLVELPVEVAVMVGSETTLRLIPKMSALTDDEGSYRFWGLPAGNYVVLSRLGVREVMGVSQNILPAPTYYPGVQTLTNADAVAVTAGSETSRVDFRVGARRHSLVTVTVLDSAGRRPSGARVFLRTTGEALRVLRAFPSGPPGSFNVPQVAPGEFELVAVIPRSDGVAEVGSLPVVNEGGDDIAVTLHTRLAARVSGRVTAIGQSEPSLSVLNVAVVPAARLNLPPANGADGDFPPATVRADGKFDMAVAGAGVIRVSGLPAGWGLLSVIVKGHDVVDRTFPVVDGEEIHDVQITVTDRLATLAGRVIDAERQIAPGAAVLLLSNDRSQWIPGTRSIVLVHASQEGRFQIQGVRPGNYFVTAVDRLQFNELRDLNRLIWLSTQAASIRIDGAARPHELSLEVRKDEPR